MKIVEVELSMFIKIYSELPDAAQWICATNGYKLYTVAINTKRMGRSYFSYLDKADQMPVPAIEIIDFIVVPNIQGYEWQSLQQIMIKASNVIN